MQQAPGLATAPLTTPALALPHGFFTRQGGVSAGPYATLNCSLSGADRRDAVLENRARAARAIGADPDRVLGLTQVHGTAVVRVAEPWPVGLGVGLGVGGLGPAADAMVTDRPGLALGIVTADCAPVLLADIEAGVIGAAHAGWRGAAAGILEATVAAMQALGALVGRIHAAIGPSIRQPSYEVGPDVRDAVLRHDAGNGRFFAPGRRDGHWQFDLPGYCAGRLAAAGLAGVAAIEADTAADARRFFSHRRRTLAGGGPIGHQISLIMLPAA
jgi:purine-nucleoside/S-methyl-5'-thioadenosine phosphorylase / adenosine deaminase